MSYIQQKNTNFIIVNTSGFENNLWLHPAMIKHPNAFEIIEDLPNPYNRLVYNDPDLEVQIEVNL